MQYVLLNHSATNTHTHTHTHTHSTFSSLCYWYLRFHFILCPIKGELWHKM